MVKVKDKSSWKPAVQFDRCFLSVYRGRKVYMTVEAYNMMGRPKKVVVFIMGRTVCLSPARVHGTDVKFTQSGQPFIFHNEASKAIGPGSRAFYSHDEVDYDLDRRSKRRYFYFKRA